MTDLLPCDFCGISVQKDERFKYPMIDHPFNGCFLAGKIEGVLNLYEKWNTRTPPPGYALVKLEDFVWQPIETVDISETVDILSNGLRYTECYWGRPTYEGKDAKYGWVCDNGYDCDGPVTNRVPNPQHWSRIPRLPQAAIRALTEES